MNIDAENSYINRSFPPKGGIKKTDLTILNTNARSLTPKITALTDCITEMNAQIAIVTETWFKEGRQLEDMKQDLSLGCGLGMTCLSREPNSNGVAYGGVAVLWRESLGTFRAFAVKNEENFEVLSCVGSMRGHSRKIVVIGCYLPPNYVKARGDRAVAFVGDVVAEAKRGSETRSSSLGGTSTSGGWRTRSWTLWT